MSDDSRILFPQEMNLPILPYGLKRAPETRYIPNPYDFERASVDPRSALRAAGSVSPTRKSIRADEARRRQSEPVEARPRLNVPEQGMREGKFKRDPYSERAVLDHDSEVVLPEPTRIVNNESDVLGSDKDFVKMSKKIADKSVRLETQTAKPFEEIDIKDISVNYDKSSLENPDFARDSSTGVAYQKLPKSRYDSNGLPMLQADIDDLDLGSSANLFLGHLRVPPNKEEIERLRAERVDRSKRLQEEGESRSAEEIQSMLNKKLGSGS